jgi:hypothetical protein
LIIQGVVKILAKILGVGPGGGQNFNGSTHLLVLLVFFLIRMGGVLLSYLSHPLTLLVFIFVCHPEMCHLEKCHPLKSILKCVILKIVTLKIVTLKSVTLKSVTLKIVTLKSVTWLFLLFLFVPLPSCDCRRGRGTFLINRRKRLKQIYDCKIKHFTTIKSKIFTIFKSQFQNVPLHDCVSLNSNVSQLVFR